jgi:membrane protein implicated in regulation of membrane protease activity
MAFWHWLVIGLALAAAEMMTPGLFYFLFMGTAAILVGIALGAWLPLPTWAQIVVFGVLAIVQLLFLRGAIQKKLALGASLKGGPVPHEMIGERGTVTEYISEDGQGKVELRGSPWTARSANGGAIDVGKDCQVERIDGLTLWVRPN